MLKKILLADDSLTIQKVVELTFTEEDYEVVVVGDGAQAIQRIGQDAPDIVLADVLMPKKTGYEVCEHVKSNPATQHVPVLLLVGKFEPFDEERARKAGADGHILKPFESSVLVKRVTELIQQAARSVAAARSVSGTDVTAHHQPGGARTDAIFDSAAPGAVEAFGSHVTEVAPPAPLVAGSDTAQFDRERPMGGLAPVPLVAEPAASAAPFGDEAEMPAPYAETPKSLLDADDDRPMSPSSFEPAPFGEEGAGAPFGEQAEAFAEPEMAPVSAPALPAAPPWEEPAPVERPLATAAAFVPGELDSAPAAPGAAASTHEPLLAAVGAVASELGVPAGELPEPVLNAIVERVVKRMSEEIVRDIAWQVVPDLAELLIKKKLEELG